MKSRLFSLLFRIFILQLVFTQIPPAFSQNADTQSAGTQNTAHNSVQAQAETQAETPVPAFAGNVTPEEWEAYSRWYAALPAEEKEWEELLQKNLGAGFYFPAYLKARLAGVYTPENPRDWGFVTDDPALPRVLLIGDSISRSYTETVRKELQGTANVHRAPANCGDAANIVRNFAAWQPESVQKEIKRWDVIYFNAGIHDRRKSLEEYEKDLRDLVKILKNQGAVLIFARTTPCRDREDGLKLYEEFNAVAEKVMAENGISVDALDDAVRDRLEELQNPTDKVHYNAEGQRLLGEHAAGAIRKVVEELNAETAGFQPCPTPQRITRQEWLAYMRLVASLPADQQRWEQLHIKYEGYHGLLWYIRPRTAGNYTPENPGIWGMLQDDPALPRVMIIGDSISLGYTMAVREALKGKANVHRPPCNCGPTTSGLAGMEDWLGDGHWDVIQFNFGLHDRRRPMEEYLGNLQTLIDRMKKTGAVLIFANTTPCTNEEDLVGYVEKMNAAAEELMRKNGVIMNDFYALLAPRYEELVGPDKCHYTADGSKIMAEATVKAVEAVLPKK